MLQHLYVKDIALIDEVEIDFDKDLNILTGETGAGKSILIGSINIALGQRSSKELLREGAEKGLVELLFSVDSKIAAKVQEYGIDCEDQVIISRSITKNGRSVSRINGETVTVNTVKSLASYLIDIHGQHEHQSLLDEQCHIELLDMFCKDGIQDDLDSLASLITKYTVIEKQITDLALDEDEKAKKINLMEFELNEIENAGLTEEEEEDLLARRKKLTHSKRIYEDCCKVYTLLHGDFDSSTDIISGLNESVHLLNELVSYDDNLEDSSKNLENAVIWIEDTASELRNYIENIEHDEGNLIEIEGRLDTIQALKRKYGDTIEEIFHYRDNLSEELNHLYHIEDKLKTLNNELKKIELQIYSLCDMITQVRKDTAITIQERITEVLQALEFEFAKFEIEIKRKEHFSKQGMDQIRFLITTNIGEKLKPLTDVASGGEMSRIMLALKTVLAEIDEIPTLIFDEIDTGISGRTAQKVAEKLSIIAKHHQVICITHLPQIAAMADQHYLIEKISHGNKTSTYVKQLFENQIEEELARLLSGVQLTETAIRNAKEIKGLANKYKESL